MDTRAHKSLGCFVYIGPLLDTLCVIISGLYAYLCVYGKGYMHDRYWVAILVVSLFLLFFNLYFGVYTGFNREGVFKNIIKTISSWGIVGVLATSIVYFYQETENFSRFWFLAVVGIGIIACSSYRILFFLVAKNISSLLPSKKVYIIGDAQSIDKIVEHVNDAKDSYYIIQGKKDISKGLNSKELEHELLKIAPHEIWLAMPLEMGKNLKETFYNIRHQTAEVRFFPDISDLPIINQRVSNVLGMFSIDLSCTPMTGSAKCWKRVEDIVISLIALVIFSPLFLFIALAIKLESRGSVIFKQYRTGINGKKFKVYKFRSMFVHEENEGNVTQASRGDSRITKVGSFLRRTSLDELPQFYNVLQGRMSVVGPRPHALAHNDYYKDLVESYMQRHKVKPGITGWAQVCGYRGETDTIDKMQKRVQMDIWYICNWSLFLDIKIVFMTFYKGFLNKNAF